MKSRTQLSLLVMLALASGASKQSTCCNPPPPPQPLDAKAFVRNSSPMAPPTMPINLECKDDQGCIDHADNPEFACTAPSGCTSSVCNFAPDPGCDCYEGQIRRCASNAAQVQFCAQTQAGVAKWQAACGPTREDCQTGIAGCEAGTRESAFDPSKAAWSFDGSACVPKDRCPAAGETRFCDPDGACTNGKQTFNGSGWTGCESLCPPDPPPPECQPGQTKGCEQGGCNGTVRCNGAGSWDSVCTAPARCPAGWVFEGSSCVWHSPHEGSFVKYFPHRTNDETVAATGSIGAVPPSGTAPIYVEVRLEQWSNPPKGANDNYCGKDTHISAWVGCIHSNGTRGYGRDVADYEWRDNANIPLRCDPGDTVGIYKHSWGFQAAWHCTRQLSVHTVRNHDPIRSCQ